MLPSFGLGWYRYIEQLQKHRLYILDEPSSHMTHSFVKRAFFKPLFAGTASVMLQREGTSSTEKPAGTRPPVSYFSLAGIDSANPG